MSQNLSKDVEGLLNLPKANQDQIFKQFAKFEKPERISVMEKHQKMLYRLKNLHLPYPIHEISYVALIFAIVQYQDEQKKIANKNYDRLSLEEIGELTTYEAKIYQAKHERPSPKTQDLMSKWGTVVYLKNKGFSFGDISGIIEDKYGIKVSIATIKRSWDRMKNLEAIGNSA
ncbi:MAG TPA: hypothetical protein PLM93_01885 [Sulfuricurvum sp.]|jgi:hypothetical protein|nr:MAG: hypothetical protein B7Y30_07010 [Campylobacterales bacterium 16-40-21]OZA03567.1 MAG: hypothetical protein B7X89_02565 [Sulfuricurvum sp. 17-40-25]HQS65920.1 hypothetical protein [Sulfuricurvum sp.]HQT35842.1 hypothetical protein [Sulfuricurvum sp.]